MDSIHNFDMQPLNMDLILKLVLKHVGEASIADLKNCRLVSHNWNKLAVPALHNHGYALELDYKKMVEFNSLLFQTQLSQLSTKHNNLASLRLSLNLFPHRFFGGMSELGKAGQLLISNSHLRLAFIKCQFMERLPEFQVDDQKKLVQLRTNQELFNLFKLASNTLTSVTIWNDNRHVPHFEEFDFERYLPLEFPRLVAVEYKVLSAASILHILDTTKHMASVLRTSKLIKLTLTLRESNRGRTSNNFRALMENCAAQNIQELCLQYWPYKEVTQVLCEMKFSKLNKLRINDGLLILTKDYNQFLAKSCPALTTMEFKWGCLCPSKDVTFECPLLPNIRHLSLYPHFSTESTSLEAIHNIFSSVISNLPCLQSMSTDFGVLTMLRAHLKNSGHLLPPPHLYPVFPSITTLEILIDIPFSRVLETVDVDELEMTTLIYRHMFPNLCNLSIKTSTVMLELAARTPYQHFTNRIHGRLYDAISVVCNHSGIQCLEIQNHTSDWVDKLVTDVLNLQGLKSLKLIEFKPTLENPLPRKLRKSKDLPAYLNLFTTTTME